MLHPVILAGGVGSRLWPLSRAAMPKQFIELDGPSSLFQQTLTRLGGLLELGTIRVLGNSEHRFLIAEQLRLQQLEGSQILLEPVSRNTAPAVTVAALAAMDEDRDAKILVLAADHKITNVPAFEQAVAAAIELASKKYLVTFGIVPGRPEIGYGYLKKGLPVSTQGFRVEEFVEKPDLETASAYVASGEHYWNSGMFLFSAAEFLLEMEIYAPDIMQQCRLAFERISPDLDFLRIPDAEFAACRSESIDYALMEKTSRAAMVPLDAGWNDLGSWQSLWDISQKDEAGNVVSGQVKVIGTRQSYVHAASRVVAAIGLENVTIVETDDAVLVASSDELQRVRQLVEGLKAQAPHLTETASLVHRPWGSYRTLARDFGFQVKHITVLPGGALSLQRHSHRSEHWTVIKGSGEIHCAGKEFVLHANQSTYIPKGAVHRLSNPGSEAVELIEVQLGDYLGEDDIERFDDVYGR
ncbi:MAG: mannose-1-phosphate guanylyltransferase/mannose-6-phosphate isomerase [Pseudomonadota bacterium]|nr:mannose-1-phosphate guanylyltransferase/mannose-6-phosphate isomerase [Pseudomonadota bacterium]MEE3011266.1 mannose-1-phosphate guanylyltransferase/mannose-6-phosphate isomerase [Pseudomonadota bacterium]